MIKRAASYLQKGIFPASNIGGIISAVLLTLLVLLTVVDVVLRHFFNAPIPGSLELIELALGIIVFLSLAYCATDDSHVVVDVLTMRFPKRVQSGIGTIMYLGSAVMLGLLSWQLFVYALRLQHMNQITAILGIEFYPFVFIAVLGSLLLTLVFFIKFLYILGGVRRQ